MTMKLMLLNEAIGELLRQPPGESPPPRKPADYTLRAYVQVRQNDQPPRTRAHRHGSYEVERSIIASLMNRVGQGETVTCKDLRAALEQQVGRRVSHMAVYRLLRRHGFMRVR